MVCIHKCGYFSTLSCILRRAIRFKVHFSHFEDIECDDMLKVNSVFTHISLQCASHGCLNCCTDPPTWETVITPLRYDPVKTDKCCLHVSDLFVMFTT